MFVVHWILNVYQSLTCWYPTGHIQYSSQLVAQFWQVVETYRGSIKLKVLNHWDRTLKGNFPLAFLFLFQLEYAMRWDTLFYHSFFTWKPIFTTATKPTDHRLKPLQSWATASSSSIMLFFLAILNPHKT